MKVYFGTRRSKKRAVIERLTAFFLSELKINSTKFDLTINTYSNFCKDTGAYGGITVQQPNRIELALDSSLSKFKLILVLAHELIHVKQVVAGQLRYQGKKTFWLGKDRTKLKYEDRPWERIAHSRQWDLVISLSKKLGSTTAEI
jgi:hypothetical protein